MIYNIIGDTHGLAHWKNLVSDKYVNIFVGDYFCPYTRKGMRPIPFEFQLNNFLEIADYKMSHPETILLIGNHDEDHWHICEGYSRHDWHNENTIRQVFEENKDLLQAAYSIENKVLVTHAGVSHVWYFRNKFGYRFNYSFDCNYDKESKTIEEAISKYREQNEFMKTFSDIPGRTYVWNNAYYVYNGEKYEKFGTTPDEICEFVNSVYNEGKYYMFNFENNCGIDDHDGSDERQGPMWIRPRHLQIYNIFKFMPYGQVVGHSMFEHPSVSTNWKFMSDQENLLSGDEDRIFFADCLQYNPESILFDSDTNTFKINKTKN